jgi:hypothetical protein
MVFIGQDQSPLLISFKSSPEARALPSTGITRLLWYYGPLRLPPGPTNDHIVTGRDPASGTGLPRCPRYLPDMLSPLPRRIGTGGSVTTLSRFGLPRILGGSASATVLSRPSQGSLTLRPVRLLQSYRLTFVPRASAGRSP